MKFRACAVFGLCLLTAAFAPPTPSHAVEESLAGEGRAGAEWVRVLSANFDVVSDSGEGEARKVSAMLEQFRYTTSQVLPQIKIKATLPTNVFLFRSHGSFHAFKPRYNGKIRNDVNGYFFGDGERSFIALTTEAGGGRAYEVIFHEYQHHILSNSLPNAPLWLDEGLAEYYSAFEPRFGGREVILGREYGRHIPLLRRAALMPLQKLFSIDQKSPEYAESGRSGLFYAQSWALTHYLMLGADGKRQPQFVRFLALLGAGRPFEESFRQAFQTDYAGMEKELREYIASYMFPAALYTLPEQVGGAKDVKVSPLSDAEVEFHLGDLLLSAKRFSEAEPRLQRAVQKDANCAECQVALGALIFRRRDYPEAARRLRAGLAIDPANYQGLHLYANILREEGRYDDAIRTYGQALAVNPRLANVYFDLSLAYSATGENTKAEEAFNQALNLSPRGDSYYRSRSRAMLRQGRGAQAAADALAFIKRRGWQDESSPYAALVAYLGYRMDRLGFEAGKLLEEIAARTQTKEWPFPVARYLRHEISAQQLISSARDGDELTEARAYIGMDLSLSGNRDDAIPHLQWVKEKGNPSLAEYEMAWGELKRIEKKEGEKPRED
jgi:tetratricopeptide (TPR) repeat protein